MLLRCGKVILFCLLVSSSCGSDGIADDKDSCSSEDVKSLSALEYVRYLKTHDVQKEWTEALLSNAKDAENNDKCEDVHEECGEMKKLGECEQNPPWMIFNCGKTCHYCHLQNQDIRCQRNPAQLPSLQFGPGSITKIIQRAIQEFPQYKPKVLSEDPWIVEFNNVFGSSEARQLINMGRRMFARSQDAGKMKTDGSGQFETIVSKARTSSTYWCLDSCWENQLVEQLISKAENITVIPRENSEYIQVLKYEPGQYYIQHHDFIQGHLDLPIGPRVFTYFMYLSDVKSGGGTYFNNLNITVEPKLGKVLLWPSVLDTDPFTVDWRTEHEALPVIEGVKYAANLWLHMYNFHTPFKVMCTG